MLKVTEIFPSIQGEGFFIGTPATFIRLYGCNLRCKWCDTQYALVGPYIDMSVEEICAQVFRLRRPITVITGGEPLIQKIEPLVTRLKESGERIHIETNGTLFPPLNLRPEHWIVSPKLLSSGTKLRHTVIRRFRQLGNSEFKFVVAGRDDFDQAIQLDCKFNFRQVCIQPVDNNLELMKKIAEWLGETHRNIRLLPQLHKLLWEGIPGR